MINLVEWFIWFVLYSFWGWALESAVSSATERGLINKGFLNSPLIPAHGIAALIAVLFLYGHTDSVLIIFITGVVICCLYEYFTSFILEKAFSLRFWDYSHHRYSIHGRISFPRAIINGVISVLLIFFVHSHVAVFTEFLPMLYARLIGALFVCIIGLDAFFTARYLFRLNGHLQLIKSAETFNTAIRALIRRDKFRSRRLFAAFPRMRSNEYDAALRKLRDAVFRG